MGTYGGTWLVWRSGVGLPTQAPCAPGAHDHLIAMDSPSLLASKLVCLLRHLGGGFISRVFDVSLLVFFISRWISPPVHRLSLQVYDLQCTHRAPRTPLHYTDDRHCYSSSPGIGSFHVSLLVSFSVLSDSDDRFCLLTESSLCAPFLR